MVLNIVTTNKEYDYNLLLDNTKVLLREYPFVEKNKIGFSVLGKELFSLKFGTGRKKIFINASHHGKEWITSILVMSMLEKLCYLYKNKICFRGFDISKIYEKTSLYICPMVNPDGVNLSINGLTDDIPQITKTRLISFNGESKDFIGKWQSNINGVDLNHNYNAGFNEGKISESREKIFSPGPTKYSGTHPESEPESQALVNFTKQVLPDIVISYHSQGEEIYYDFNGCIPKGAKRLSEIMEEITGYQPLKPTGMASFSGYKDWVIKEFGIPAFTIEVGKGENPLPVSQFDAIFDKNLPLLIYLMN